MINVYLLWEIGYNTRILIDIFQERSDAIRAEEEYEAMYKNSQTEIEERRLK